MLLCCIIFSCTLLLASYGMNPIPSPYVMPWMCLERCGYDSNQITQHLQQIQNYSQQGLINAVSYEKYNLGPNGTLILNNLTDVTSILQSYGVLTIPMISSYPYPPQFLDWMRELWSNENYTNDFINDLITQANLYNYNGYNIDWEPTTQATEEDAINYANFLDLLSVNLHKSNLYVTMDFAVWSNLWNITLLYKTNLDLIIDMSTYTTKYSTWIYELNYALNGTNHDSNNNLCIGLETVNDTNDAPMNEKAMEQRINELNSRNVTRIGIWDMPLESYWERLLQQFWN